MVKASSSSADGHPGSAVPLVLGLSAAAAALYGWLAAAGDLRGRPADVLAVHAALTAIMLLVWSVVRRRGGMRVALGAALLFRLIAAWGAPTLSDDVYRYVWDGRVQLHGHHPYRYAPADPALADLRDADWSRINHPELPTIYPAVAQVFFLLLAACGAGTTGFKLALGAMDFGVVLALAALLRRLGLPRERVLLYAWNPLAVVETAGSGHVEPLGVLAVLLAARWIIERRPTLSTFGLAAAVHVKLLPVALIPGFFRRWNRRARWWWIPALIVPLLPYALTGPAVGAGLFAYAQRWERNAVIFSGLRAALAALDSGARLAPWIEAAQARVGATWIPWDSVARQLWPPELARLIVVAAALIWIAVVLRRRRDPVHELLLVLGGVLLLAPTLHPWYLLWVLPLAAARASWGWLLLAALAPLAYWTPAGDVPWALRALEYGPPGLLAAALGWRARTARLRRRRS